MQKKPKRSGAEESKYRRDMKAHDGKMTKVTDCKDKGRRAKKTRFFHTMDLNKVV